MAKLRAKCGCFDRRHRDEPQHVAAKPTETARRIRHRRSVMTCYQPLDLAYERNLSARLCRALAAATFKAFIEQSDYQAQSRHRKGQRALNESFSAKPTRNGPPYPASSRNNDFTCHDVLSTSRWPNGL